MSIRKKCIIKVLSVRIGAIMTFLQCHCNSQEPLNAKSEVKSNKRNSFFHIESCIPLRQSRVAYQETEYCCLEGWRSCWDILKLLSLVVLTMAMSGLVYEQSVSVSVTRDTGDTGAWHWWEQSAAGDGPAPSHRGDRSSASGSVSSSPDTTYPET